MGLGGERGGRLTPKPVIRTLASCFWEVVSMVR